MKTGQVPAIFGGHKINGKRYVWVLSLADLRVYLRDESTHMDTMTIEVDDFLGDLPEGVDWDYQMVLGNKRIEQLMNRVKSHKEKLKQKESEE